jgi:hypothetical protein
MGPGQLLAAMLPVMEPEELASLLIETAISALVSRGLTADQARTMLAQAIDISQELQP